MTNKKGGYTSMIDSTFIVSESEVAMVYPEYDVSWLVENIDDLKTILWDLGMDTVNENFTLSEVVQHRNRLGKIVTCGRFVGIERSDVEYLQSGYASQEAIDKSRNSRLCDDIYRSRGLTTDMQDAMEKRDKYRTNEDENEEW